MAKGAAANVRTRLLGSLLWGMIDIAGLRPCREPVRSNTGTAQVTAWVIEALAALPRERRPAGFVAVAGESRYLRTEFPERLLSNVAAGVTLLVRALADDPAAGPVSVAGPEHRILLRVGAERASLRGWIEEQQDMRPAAEPPEARQSTATARLAEAALADLPADYADRYEALRAFREEMQGEIAARLQPALRRQAEAMPCDSYADKQEVAVWVNSQTRELGLALRCPNTGHPAILTADVRDAASGSSRFRFVIRDERGRQTKTVSSSTLPELVLMPDEPRREARARGPAAGQVPAGVEVGG